MKASPNQFVTRELTSGAGLKVPASPFVHVFVSRGAVTLDGTGDLDKIFRQ